MSTKEYRYAVYIGRFQPPHPEHINAILQALKTADELIVVLGSADTAACEKNPWTTDQREQMIRAALEELQEGSWTQNIHFVSVRDHFYVDTDWHLEVIKKVGAITEGVADEAVCLMTHHKDASSTYLKDFPNWATEHILSKNHPTAATWIRNKLFGDNGILQEWDGILNKSVEGWIRKWTEDEPQLYADLREEHEKMLAYRDMWRKTPHPVIFTTTDALVTVNNYVLVVKRKFTPGKGLYALPGGFLKPTETIKDGIIRELKEETRIEVSRHDLLKNLKSVEVFDYPTRDPRGRVVTHCGIINLEEEDKLPKVKGSDDAEHAVWMSVYDILKNADKFYADHAQMIYHLIWNKRRGI